MLKNILRITSQSKLLEIVNENKQIYTEYFDPNYTDAVIKEILR